MSALREKSLFCSLKTCWQLLKYCIDLGTTCNIISSCSPGLSITLFTNHSILKTTPEGVFLSIKIRKHKNIITFLIFKK